MDNKTLSIINLVYMVADNKDEMISVASFLLRHPEMASLLDNLVVHERIDETARMKFATNDNENMYKQAISIVSALSRGAIDIELIDLIIPKDEVKTYKDNGSIDNMKKVSTTDRFNCYRIKDESDKSRV